MAGNIRGITIELGADTSKFKKGTQEVGKAAEDAGKAVVAASAAMAAAATAAAVELGKAVVNAYADYEQLTGGVETLFKDSAGAVQEYAENAYKTAGLSANEYMETVTGFSASLISSLDGDTGAAADLANQAIIDMSDNANKMGSDISAIQNAYSGFAKQNYTMLDNLKLGYGGTKAEMERLIADANEIAKAQGEAGDLTIESYADVIEAIHLVQTEMGITGTTAKEAEATISGSISMTQSAWENFITSLGTGEGMEGALNSLIDSAMLVVENITPVVERLIEAVPKVVAALIPVIIELVPQLTETAIQLVTEIMNALIEALPIFAEAIATMATTLWDTFKETIIGKYPEAEGAFAELEATVTGWFESIKEIVQTALDFIYEFWEKYGAELTTSLSAAWDTITGIVDGAFTIIKDLFAVFSAILNGDVDALWEAVKKLFSDAWESITGIMSSALDAVNGVLTVGLEIIDNLFSSAWEKLKTAASEVAENVKEAILGVVETAKTWGHDLMANFISGIREKINALREMVEGVADTVKDFLGFSEPKKGPLSNFHTYAPDMMQLFASGIKDNMHLITDQMNALGSNLSGSVRSTANLTLTTPVYLDGRVIASVVNNQLGVLL